MSETSDGGPETETLDKLFLELSQFTKARTEREINLTAAYDAMANKVEKFDQFGLALMMIREGCADPAGIARAALSRTKEG